MFTRARAREDDAQFSGLPDLVRGTWYDELAVTASAVTSRAVTIAAGAVLAGTGLWRLLSRRHFR